MAKAAKKRSKAKKKERARNPVLSIAIGVVISLFSTFLFAYRPYGPKHFGVFLQDNLTGRSSWLYFADMALSGLISFGLRARPMWISIGITVIAAVIGFYFIAFGTLIIYCMINPQCL
jgi:hypothetical protein